MIEMQNLTSKFGNMTAVDDITLRVEDGEVFGFLCPNGAGKTTTVRMLCCLISMMSGNARIGDYNIGNKQDAKNIGKMIGLVPDNVGLSSLHIESLIKFCLAALIILPVTWGAAFLVRKIPYAERVL